MKNVHKTLVGKPEFKGPLQRCTRGCEVNIKMDLKVWGMKCIHLSQDIVQWLAFWADGEPSDSIKGEGFLQPSERILVPQNW